MSSASNLKNVFEQKVKDATPKDPSKGNVKPVGQREYVLFLSRVFFFFFFFYFSVVFFLI